MRFLVKDPKVKKISILAHSMGNWVTLEALRQMAIRDGRIAAKIKLVLLADPDVDVDVSREQIAAMGPDRPHIALFISEDDQALAASKEVWGAPRLGAINPNIEPYKSMLERENITVINLTKLPSSAGQGFSLTMAPATSRQTWQNGSTARTCSTSVARLIFR